MNGVLLAFVGYLAIQLAIGAWLAPKIHTESDYRVAGRTSARRPQPEDRR